MNDSSTGLASIANFDHEKTYEVDQLKIWVVILKFNMADVAPF